MAYTDPMFKLGMSETLNFGNTTMGRMNSAYQRIVELVHEAIEQGATSTSDIYGYVTQYVSPELVTHETIQDIVMDW